VPLILGSTEGKCPGVTFVAVGSAAASPCCLQFINSNVKPVRRCYTKCSRPVAKYTGL
jgi:hypothetical protein